MRHVLLCAATVLSAACQGAADDAANTPTSPAPPTSLVAAVTMGTGAAQLAVGGTLQLSATPRTIAGAGTAAKNIMLWSSSAPDVATVTQNGLVTAVAPGTANIIATADGHSGMTQITVTATAAAR